MKIKFAFTLAEVLITLVIVGIVAALTIPAAVSKYQEQQVIQSLKTLFSTFGQALKMAEAQNGPVETWDINPGNDGEGSAKLYNYIAPHLSKVKECKQNSGCFADSYQTLQGTVQQPQPKTYHTYSRGILNNGIPFLVWSGGSGCTYSSYLCGIIRVDINGDKKPNRYGYDFFTFYITKNGIKPGGYQNLNMCKYDGTHEENGVNCTAWVLYKNNFDYKYKSISW